MGWQSQRQPSPSLGNSGRVEPVHPTQPGITRLLTGLDPPEERGERLVEAPQRGLLAGERPAALAFRVERPDLLKLRRLVPVADARFRPMPVRVPAFLPTPRYKASSDPPSISDNACACLDVGRRRNLYPRRIRPLLLLLRPKTFPLGVDVALHRIRTHRADRCHEERRRPQKSQSPDHYTDGSLIA